jgi:hypothetical protein
VLPGRALSSQRLASLGSGGLREPQESTENDDNCNRSAHGLSLPGMVNQPFLMARYGGDV